MTKFEPGEHVILRSVRETGRVGMVCPVIVVADREDLVALYLAPGAVCKRRAGKRGGPRGRQLVEDTGLHEDMIWRENRRLMLWRPDRHHAVSLFWRDADDTFLCWYVDILVPFRRTSLGFDTRDLTLDVVISPDRTRRFKDEDELDWAAEQGTIARDEAERIREEAGRAIALFEDGDPIYAEEWISWRPQPEWRLPSIPDGWDRTVI
jgi:uncharacterized protein